MRLQTLAVLLLFAAPAAAQQTIFNVPSPDVLSAGSLYGETDWYLRPWTTNSGTARTFYVRAVTGLGHDVEAGLNAGAFDLDRAGASYLDAAVKWRPLYREQAAGAWGMIVGDHAGMGVQAPSAGHSRDLAYASLFGKESHSGVRLGAGPYWASKEYFGKEQRGGLVTLEIPVPGLPALSLSADWFSGPGGYATPGLVCSLGRWALYAAYGLANTGRQDDLLTLELGYTFISH